MQVGVLNARFQDAVFPAHLELRYVEGGEDTSLPELFPPSTSIRRLLRPC